MFLDFKGQNIRVKYFLHMVYACIFLNTYFEYHRKPTGVLEGHTAPVFFVKADSTNSRIYSVGNDNTIRVNRIGL